MRPATPEHPILTVCIELPETLSSLFDPGSAINRALCEAVEQGLSELMVALGIPGRPDVRISPLMATADKIIRVLIDEKLTRYPEELLVHAYSYVNERLLDPDAKAAGIVPWLQERCQTAADPAGQRIAVEFIRTLCLEIVKRQPAVLLGPAQVKAYEEALGDNPHGSSAFTAPEPERLASVLVPLLEMRISIANRATVADVLARGSKDQGQTDLVVEDLIDALRAEAVEIQLPRSFLQQLTSRWEQEGLAAFPTLRDGLYVELGIGLPPLRFVAVESLKANCLAFKVNHLTSLPLRGLHSDQCLVNDSAERVREHNIDSSPTTNPATGQPGSVVNVDMKARVESLGFTTWNQIEHLVLCVTEFLRRYAWCTIHRGVVQEELQKLEKYFPTLVTTIRPRHSDDEITALLRSHVRDRVSVQNLRAILEGWLDYDVLSRTRVDSGSKCDAALASPLAFTRIALGHEIAHKAARTTGTVVVYLVDPEIERLVSAHSISQLGDEGDAILRALRVELAYLPPAAHVPSLLTFTEVRAALQQLVATEFPRMSVIAHEELPPGVNVMPVARIKLEERPPAAAH